ncbi:MAG: LPXTG cell wall anchor domain-containing protein [Acidobacteria bacterium]|nr:LPXTG cell wall anchor domain-containing protein [Acidobacteriota bacterium]
MEIFQKVMNYFFVLLVLVAGGIGFWFFKKRKEGNE